MVVLGATLDSPNQSTRQKRVDRKWGGLGGPEHFFSTYMGQANFAVYPDHLYPYLYGEARHSEPKVQENIKKMQVFPVPESCTRLLSFKRVWEQSRRGYLSGVPAQNWVKNDWCFYFGFGFSVTGDTSPLGTKHLINIVIMLVINVE